jgi:putative endopeptidase
VPHSKTAFRAIAPMLCASFLLCASAFAQKSGKPLDLANFDTTVKPADDFFRYANGNWMARNTIPPDQSLWGSFSELQEQNYAVLHDILEEAAKDKSAPEGSAKQMVGDLYSSGMDFASIEAQGIAPLADEFERIKSLKDPAGLQAEIAHLQMMGIAVPFAFFANQDAKKSTDVIPHLSQSGLGLPDRDYYTKEDVNSKQLRDQYADHIKKMFVLLGDDSATAGAEAATVMQIETELAKASMTRVERRDPNATYHKMTLDGLTALAPDLSWKPYFTDLGLSDPGSINVGMPAFMKKIDTMISSVPIDQWKVYLRWHLVNSTADYLNAAIVDEDFRFGGAILTGAKEIRPRWKRILEATNRGLGEDLGQLYVAKTFTPEAKARAREMVMNLKAALHDKIATLEWMSDSTKEQAFKKLDAFGVKIGYPDKWRDYSALKINRGPYVLNVLAARRFEFNRNLQKIGKPVDHAEWRMTPPTVNASYSPNMNDITFPAGILQPPFYDPNADDAFNYGGMGAVIGHEMTHGFDDQGRKFDAAGNLTDWWKPDDAKNFTSRASMVEKQFSGYTAIDTLHVNGKLTLGENIADLGGLKIAFAAYQKTLEGKPRPEKIDGLTPEQRFFLAWAQIWRVNIRPEAVRLRLNTDPHAPGRFRCNGPLSNMKEFLDAFNVADGSPMARPPDERARIW